MMSYQNHQNGFLKVLMNHMIDIIIGLCIQTVKVKSLRVMNEHNKNGSIFQKYSNLI